MPLAPADVLVGDLLRITQTWRVITKTGDSESNYEFTFESTEVESDPLGPFDLAALQLAYAIEWIERPFSEGDSVVFESNAYTILGLSGSKAWLSGDQIVEQTELTHA